MVIIGVPGLLAVCLFGMTSLAHGAEADELPEILTLSEALTIASDDHPRAMYSRAELAQAEAESRRIDQQTGLRANLIADARTVDRLADPGHEFVDDSRLLLVVDKPLGRFGAISDSRSAQELRIEARGLELAAEQARLRLSIIRAFLEVIIADYAYLAIDEENTLGYLAFDDAQEEMERFGEFAEADVRALEAVYLDAFARRTAASNARRSARFRLALALNRPNGYPDQLVEPELSAYDRPLPDFDVLVALALEQNHAVMAARLELQSARDSLSLLSRTERPTVGIRLQAAEYNQTFSGSRDQFRASLYLDLPLVNGPRKAGDIAQQNAEVLALEAELALTENRVRSELLALVQNVSYLESEKTAAEAELLAAELKLDRVRLEYEMELKARIGRANWDVARALHRLIKARYQRALTWEQIDFLTGQTPVSFNVE